MITIKTQAEREIMREAGQIVRETLHEVSAAVEPGITTKQLDSIAEKAIRARGGNPSSLGFNGFTGSICTSVDDEVVHGIPGKRVLKEGEIISIDCTAQLRGYNADSAVTVPVGKVSDKALELIRVTEESFWQGAQVALEGNRIGDIGSAVQTYCAQRGFDAVRAYCGHGIGQDMHEEPEVPNYGVAGRGVRLQAGMCICVEPMIVTGGYAIYILDDGWTSKTRDGGLCSHYEHTLFIRPGGQKPDILTLEKQPEGWS